MAVGTCSGCVTIVDTVSGTAVSALEPHSHPVQTVAWCWPRPPGSSPGDPSDLVVSTSAEVARGEHLQEPRGNEEVAGVGTTADLADEEGRSPRAPEKSEETAGRQDVLSCERDRDLGGTQTLGGRTARLENGSGGSVGGEEAGGTAPVSHAAEGAGKDRIGAPLGTREGIPEGPNFLVSCGGDDVVRVYSIRYSCPGIKRSFTAHIPPVAPPSAWLSNSCSPAPVRFHGVPISKHFFAQMYVYCSPG